MDTCPKIGDWSVSQEREFMESLMNERLNFTLVIYSLVWAGAVSADKKAEVIIVLLVGTILCSLLSYTVYHAYTKVRICVDCLKKIEEHPVRWCEQEVSARFPRSKSVNPVIGNVLPIICPLSILFGIILVILDVWVP